MRCPYCGFIDSKVINSRPSDEGKTIKRRRECIKCQKRFTTYEKIEKAPILIIKKDNRREEYDRGKILNGIIKACQKRPVSIETMNQIVDEIENDIYNSMRDEITSREIGEMVMEKLKELDQISYVRFASVYREFKDINTFLNELQKLLSEKSDIKLRNE
ncbi:transcriptional regulator NrdR [Caldicellulosiruptoraceae bacterium PP1]